LKQIGDVWFVTVDWCVGGGVWWGGGWQSRQSTGIGPLCDIVTGFMFPGYPIANVCFRLYSSEAIVQGLAYLRCSKLGHYMKIPPRELLAVLVSNVPQKHFAKLLF
jgi:hypothetical protein